MMVTIKCATCGKKKKRSGSVVRNNHYCGRKCFLKSRKHYALISSWSV